MSRSARLAFPVLAALALLPRAVRADTGDVHVTIGGGVAHPLAEEVFHSGRIFFIPAPPSDGLEGHVHGAVRMTVKPGVAVSLDFRRVSIERGPAFNPVVQRVTHVGPGIRRTMGSESVRPYLQVNLFLVEQWLDRPTQASDQSLGMGVTGGADLKVSDLVSIPIEVHAIFGRPDRDASTLGVETGLTFRLFSR